MNTDVNWIAILLATISTMIVGSIWYGPLFGKVWMKLAKVNRDPNMTSGQMALMYIKAFLGSAITAIVLAYAVAVFHKSSSDNYLLDAVFVAVVLWAGFTAARIFMHDLFEGRRKKLTLLSLSNELVTIVVMAVIIGLLPV